MGTRERRQRDFAQREQRILDTAQELIQRDGLLNLQMSRLAEACDYAVGTLYQHFAKKEDLLVALNTRNCLSRVELFERAAHWGGPARERLLAVALADTLLLDRSPEMFRLQQFVFTEVVWGAASAERRAEALEAGAPIESLVSGIVRNAIAAGDLPSHGLDMAPLELALGAWTLCMGMHDLIHAEGVLEGHDVPRPYHLLFKHLNHLLNGYGWRPMMTPVDDAGVGAQIARLCRDVFAEPLPGGAAANAALPSNPTPALEAAR
jgi:AcrR family transcriptional regulator